MQIHADDRTLVRVYMCVGPHGLLMLFRVRLGKEDATNRDRSKSPIRRREASTMRSRVGIYYPDLCVYPLGEADGWLAGDGDSEPKPMSGGH